MSVTSPDRRHDARHLIVIAPTAQRRDSKDFVEEVGVTRCLMAYQYECVITV